jgi:hypothetical protein
MPRDFLQPSTDPLALYRFRFRDPVSGKWVRARYAATLVEIAARHVEWEIAGPPEIRAVDPDKRYFSPHYGLVPRAHLPVEDPPQNEPPRPDKEPPGKDPPVKEPPEKDPPVKEPPVEDPAALIGLERFLMLIFLRRYVTYCARRRRFPSMNGAARLFVEIGAPATEPLG